jgi:hypothetical protein
MSKQFWSFLAVGLAIVAAAVAVIWTGTKGAHLEINGKILNVRGIHLGDSELVAVDFRVTNPSDVPFVVNEVSLRLGGQEQLKGMEVSPSDVDTMFQVHPQLGGKDNDVLAPPQTIPPGKTLYRMAEASFTGLASIASVQKDLVIHIEDVDGASFDISSEEKPK